MKPLGKMIESGDCGDRVFSLSRVCTYTQIQNQMKKETIETKIYP